MYHDEQILVPDSATASNMLKDKLAQASSWAWEHKKWILITTASAVGIIFLVKKRNAIKGLLKLSSKIRSIIDPSIKPIAKKKVPSIPSDVLEHRTGIMLTATKLGNQVGVSNREINKRLISAGLIRRLTCGECTLTEDGKLLGEASLKVTPWNKTVPLIQWDESVLNIIFSPEELAEIAERQQRIQNILNGKSV